MTTTIENLETIAQWLRNDVCCDLKFKQPDDNKVGQTYDYKMVTPEVHIMYPPTKDINPAKTQIVPYICVQFDDKADYPKQHSGMMGFRLNFATWNPGIHNKGAFDRNAEGWRDVWNFVDITQSAIENTEVIGHIRVCLENGIKCAPFKEQNAIADFYPYWFAYLTFTGEFARATIHKKYDHLL